MSDSTAENLRIREERTFDHERVYRIHESVFAGHREALLGERLRHGEQAQISLVAEHVTDPESGRHLSEGESRLLGHVMASRVALSGYPDRVLMALAPLAVLPQHQRHGIGKRLVISAVKRCRLLGAGAVVAAGHADFYAHLGFHPARHYGLYCNHHDVPGAFVAFELVSGYLQGLGGEVLFHHNFMGSDV
ncbi:GNAT family N-acetyltransferase [Cobetia sp. QF-1]|uniref:GNAT family N-acetyltransferase n=1 Tax=Cobetia sp. QF-1 TaxID=1969833 RepID=UPI000B5449F3|nr:N-acetyltransferase [Cobetia sp. QF-1]